jgi:hypothetical protein
MFKKYTVHRTRGVYRLLILNSYSSYITLEFDLFYKEYSIITLCILLYSSHLLQPLDVGYFAVLKRSYGRQIKGYIHNRFNHINKPDFLHTFYTVRTEAITLANVQSSFAATGLVPHDLKRVLSKLHTQFKTPTPPSTSHANTPANTQP